MPSKALTLIPEDLEKTLPRLYATEGQKDPVALVKLFAPDSTWRWYVTEFDPATRTCFGLVDGHETEFGYFSLNELEQAKGPLGCRIERDLYFTPTPISQIERELSREHHPHQRNQNMDNKNETTTKAYPACECGGRFNEVDSAGRAATVRCNDCNEVCLFIETADMKEPTAIWLRDFDARRGDGPDRRPLSDRHMAEHLMFSVASDLYPSPATMTDFGMRGEPHFVAFRTALECGATAYELDRILGDGAAITKYVHTVTAGRTNVKFETPYDIFYELKTRSKSSASVGPSSAPEHERER